MLNNWQTDRVNIHHLIVLIKYIVLLHFSSYQQFIYGGLLPVGKCKEHAAHTYDAIHSQHDAEPKMTNALKTCVYDLEDMSIYLILVDSSWSNL